MKHPLKAGNLHETLQRSTKEQVYIDDDTLCVPLLRGHEGIGVLNLNSYKGPRYDPGFLIKFKMLLYFLTREIKNYFISRDIEELSLSDELTGLYNRRYLLWELNREIKRVQRYRGTLSILYINIENFKIVNDTYGYKTGDLLLTLISHQLKKLMRTTDFIGRYEGEKFIAMLTETDHKGAAVLHKRIIHRISNKDFDIGGKTPVNIKVKVYNAEYDFKIKNGSEFIEHIKTLAEKEEEQKQTPDSPASTETRGPGKKEISREPGTVPQKKDAGERAAPSHARNVHVYFIEPLELISVVIDTLVKMGFESYQVDLKDKMKLLQILDKEIRNVIFICISSESDLASWFEYINHIQKLEDDNIQVGIFAYSRINPGYCMKFLERNIAVIKFSDIQADTVSVLKKILIYFEAKGRRGYVRVEACDDSSAFINLDSEHLVIKARIHTISEQFFTCYFEKKDLHHLVQGRYFTKVLLRLKGTVVQISTKILTTKKDDPRYCVMQICSALYKNKRITYTSSLKKETKDKIHRYIRYCLKENLKKRLLSL
jgi:diguanylate cyclase (GGDEF)-like protein